MERLADAVSGQPGAVRPPAPARSGWRRPRRPTASSTAAEFTSDEVPIAPQRIIRLLQETFPDDGIITCDAGENRLFMMHWYRPKSANSYLQPAAGGGMGYAVPPPSGPSWPARTARCWPCAATAGSPCRSTPS